MSAEWKCPRCETLNKGDGCEICGYTKKEFEAEFKKAEPQQSVFAQYTTGEDIKQSETPKNRVSKAPEETEKSQEPEKSEEPEKSAEPAKPAEPAKLAEPTKPAEPAKPVEPVKPSKSEVPERERSTAKATTKKDNGSKIVGGLAAAAVVAALVMNGTKANEYESNLDVFMNNFRSEDRQIEHYLKKGREALDDVDADAAEYFFKDKVLALESDNEEAIVGCIRASRWQDDTDQISKYVVKLSKAVDEVSSHNEQEVTSSVDELCQPDYDALAAAIKDKTVTKDHVNAFFASYGEYIRLFESQWFQDGISKKYVEIYDLMTESGTSDAVKKYFLTKAMEDFPLDLDLLERQEDAKIQKHLKKAYDLFKSKDYEKMQKFINDSPYTNATYYYIDGVYTKLADSGHGMILDPNGIYVGDIANGRRNGSGVQFFYYEGYELKYRVMDGAWSDNALNGEASVTWFSPNGTKAVTSGNFTDGFYDGEMTVKWDGWTGSYTAKNGKITSGEMVGGEYRYAYVSNSSGASAWWHVEDPDDQYGFGLVY